MDAPDTFDAAGIRARVLAGWAASPARFREDANAEEDLVLGGYRDRLLVELAQNAADAATRAGVPGVLRLSIVDGELRAANTGEPLTAAGVQSLATLRASAKRGSESVGRFGVGFAAVLAVSDSPAVISTTGGVRFSADRSRAAAAELPALAEELARRDGQVPILRLPWPAAGSPPDGFATEVRLPLREGAERFVRDALAALRAELLLALPGLDRIELADRVLSIVDGTVLADGDTVTRWQVVTRSGVLPPTVLTDRPVEERERPQWTVTWAVPLGADGRPRPLPGKQVVHAPTPSDEPLSLPVRLIGAFPLDPARRHVPPGPLTDLLVRYAAGAYAELLTSLPADPAVLALVPRAGLAAAELDAALSTAILAELRDTAWLPATEGGSRALAAETVAAAAADPELPLAAAGSRITPAEAVVVDAASPELVEALAGVLPGLLPARWSGRNVAAALNALGVRRLSTVDVVELVGAVDRPPAWWQRLYAAVEYADRDALSGLPVPLADGRTVTGPRGVLLPLAGLPADLDVLGLRVAHPEAAHPLLERLGAVPATPAGVLADGRVRAAVESSYDDDDPEPIAEAVLALTQAADLEPGALPWLAELALPTQTGDWAPAGELLLPGSTLAEVIDPESPFELLDADFAESHDPRALAAVGVLGTFAVLRVSDVDILVGEHELDGEDAYYAAVADRMPAQDVPPRLAELVAVRDLELVHADRWPRALDLLATEPLRSAILTPAIATTAAGTRYEVPSYTAWWLAHHPILDGQYPTELRTADALSLAGLYDPAPYAPGILELAGCLSTVDGVLADPELAADLLDRLGDPERPADPLLLREAYGRLAIALDGFDLPPPPTVRVAPDLVLPAGTCVVLDLPYLLPLLAGRPVVPSGGQPGAVSDLLGLPFASEVVTAEPHPDTGPHHTEPWTAVPGAVLAAERCGANVPAATVAWHDPLLVAGQRVPWWPDGDTDHIDRSAGASALGRALAWRLDRWPQRAAATEALDPNADPSALRAEDAAG